MLPILRGFWPVMCHFLQPVVNYSTVKQNKPKYLHWCNFLSSLYIYTLYLYAVNVWNQIQSQIPCFCTCLANKTYSNSELNFAKLLKLHGFMKRWNLSATSPFSSKQKAGAAGRHQTHSRRKWCKADIKSCHVCLIWKSDTCFLKWMLM